MDVDIYLAASLEGYIADAKGRTDWVADDELFEKTAREYGCICMGRRTYDEYGGPAFEGLQHIVLTKRLPRKTKFDNVHYASTPQEAIDVARVLGFKKLLVIGGARTNQAFMQAELVRKVYADIHPILLGKGIPMFGDYQAKFDFNMSSNEWHDEGFMHAEYSLGQTHRTAVTVVVRDPDGAYFMHRLAGKQWEIGASSIMSDIETPHRSAMRIARSKLREKIEPSPCFEYDYKDGDLLCTMHVFELFVKKRKPYQQKHEWDETAWLTAEEVGDHIADKTITPVMADLYQKYREKM